MAKRVAGRQAPHISKGVLMLFEKCVRAELGLRCIPGCAGWKRGKVEEDRSLECVVWTENGPRSWEIVPELRGESLEEFKEREISQVQEVLFQENLVEVVQLQMA
ncbi:MAG: hypothetical protein WHT07_00855 [Desulfobaccales bacterium]|jgi:hypothetical protein